MSPTHTPPPLVEHVATWFEQENTNLRTAGVDMSHRVDGSSNAWMATVECEAQQRLGYLTIWESGEMDCQVLRRADNLLVLNEHRLITEIDDLDDALAVFRLVVMYQDPRE